MTKQQANVLNKVTGKAFEELSEKELTDLSTEIENRRRAVREALETEQYSILTKAASDIAIALTWEKLPRMLLTPDATGKSFEISFPQDINEKKTRTKNSNGGDLTIHKIGLSKGGIAKFKDKDGKEYPTIQDLIKALNQPDGKPESDRCWDINVKNGISKGIASSDIVTKYHADEVTLIYQDGKEQTVKAAIEEYKTKTVA